MNIIKKHLQAQIARTGVAVLGIFDADPSFTYTVGMYPMYGYELITFGIDPRAATVMFNDLREHLAAGKPLPLNTPMKDFTQLLITVPFKFQRIPPGGVDEYAVQAFEYFENQNIPFLQMVVADRNSKFPEDPHYEHDFMDPIQPLLYKIYQ
jgi:hypothetical protein